MADRKQQQLKAGISATAGLAASMVVGSLSSDWPEDAWYWYVPFAMVGLVSPLIVQRLFTPGGPWIIPKAHRRNLILGYLVAFVVLLGAFFVGGPTIVDATVESAACWGPIIGIPVVSASCGPSLLASILVGLAVAGTPTLAGVVNVLKHITPN